MQETVILKMIVMCTIVATYKLCLQKPAALTLNSLVVMVNVSIHTGNVMETRTVKTDRMN